MYGGRGFLQVCIFAMQQVLVYLPSRPEVFRPSGASKTFAPAASSYRSAMQASLFRQALAESYKEPLVHMVGGYSHVPTVATVV